MSSLPRIIYAGTPEFAVPALRALLAAGYPVLAVYTQPDRPAGRGRVLTPSPVKVAALDAGLPVEQPLSLRDGQAAATLAAFGADLMVVAAYGLILPPAVLAAPRLGCVNIHASLLPRWRGAAPIQRALAAGDAETGICIMGMEAGLDTGPVYLRRSLAIGPRDTGGALHDRLAALGAEALLAALPGIGDGSLPAEPQDPALACYAPKLTKAEARLDWSRPALDLDRLIRAFDPWPVAETALCGETLRIWAAEPIASPATLATPASAPPGTLIAVGRAGIDVATGDGCLRLTRVQAPGRRPTAAGDFAHARELVGAVLV